MLHLQGRLRPDTIAQAYYQQFPEACWEDIVILLCEDYNLKHLATAEIVKKHIPTKDSDYRPAVSSYLH